MPVISFASSKGGAGKTTACLVLAGELSHAGALVEIIDADMRRPIQAWSKLPGKPPNITVTPADEESIVDAIELARGRAHFTLVDLEGLAAMTVSYAMRMSDLVIIPSQEQQQDAVAAINTAAAASRESRVGGREIPVTVLLSRTRVVAKGRTARAVSEQLRGLQDVLAVELAERDAYAAIHSIGGTVRDLRVQDVPGVARAIENAEALAVEIIETLKGKTAA